MIECDKSTVGESLADIEAFVLEVEARAAKATPGPWTTDEQRAGFWQGPWAVVAPAIQWRDEPDPHGPGILFSFNGNMAVAQVVADSDFAAHARTDVPRLIAIVRAQWAELSLRRARRFIGRHEEETGVYCGDYNQHRETGWACNACGAFSANEHDSCENCDNECIRLENENKVLRDRVAELEKLAYLGDHHFADLTYKQCLEEEHKRVAKLEAGKQAVIDGMTRAIEAEGRANKAFYEMQAERDVLNLALRAANVALKKGPLEEWEAKALAAGWKPPQSRKNPTAS